jgi:hypothetical protein
LASGGFNAAVASDGWLGGDPESVRVGRSAHVAAEAVAAYKRHLVEARRNTAA